MKKWKSKEERKQGVWSSEINLKTSNATRTKKVKKLLSLLREETIETVL